MASHSSALTGSEPSKKFPLRCNSVNACHPLTFVGSGPVSRFSVSSKHDNDRSWLPKDRGMDPLNRLWLKSSIVKCGHTCDNAPGSEPRSRLPERSIARSTDEAVEDTMDSVPSKKFDAKLRVRRVRSEKTDDGMLPSSMLSLRSNDCNNGHESFDKPNNVPVSQLDDKSSCVMSSAANKDEGSDEVKLLADKDKEFRADNVPNSLGMDPLSPFELKSNDCRSIRVPMLAGSVPLRFAYGKESEMTVQLMTAGHVTPTQLDRQGFS